VNFYLVNEKMNIVRRSSNSTVLNEVDLAQYLIWNKVFFNQIIVTPAYVFMLYYIPDEDRTVPQVEFKEN